MRRMMMALKFINSGSLPLSLTTNLTAWWKLNETSGTRINSVSPGTYDLTETGTVGSTTGILGNAVAQPSSFHSNYLSTPHSTVFGAMQNFSFSQWVYFLVGVESYGYLGKAGGSNYDWYASTLSGNTATFQCDNAGTVNFSTPGAYQLTTGVWYHVVFTHNFSTKNVVWYINNAVWASGTYSDTINHTYNSPLRLTYSYAGTSFVTDEIAFWSNRVLTASDVATLYNGGLGITY